MNENLEKLYNSLRNDYGENFSADFNTFANDMKDSGKRNKLYENMRRDYGSNFTKSFDEFSSDLGFASSVPFYLQRPEAQEELPQPTSTTQAQPNAAQQQTGFWKTAAGDVIEKLGAGVSNTIGGLSKVVQGTPYMKLAQKYGDWASKKTGIKPLIPNNDLARYLLDTGKKLGERGDFHGNIIDEETGEERKKTYRDLWKEGNKLGAVGEVMLTATESAPTSALAMVPFAGLPLVSMSAAGQKYDELDENAETKDLPEWKKLFNSAVSGTLEGLTERLGAKVDLKMIEPFLKKMTESTVKGILKKGGVNALMQTITEELEEVVSQLGENVVDYATGVSDEYKPLEGVLDSFVYGTGGGAQFGGVTGSAAIYRAGQKAIENKKLNAFEKELVKMAGVDGKGVNTGWMQQLNSEVNQQHEAVLNEVVNPTLPQEIDVNDTANHIDTRIGVINARRAMEVALDGVDFTVDERIAEMSVAEQKAIVQDVLSDDALNDEQKQSIINYVSAAALDRNLKEAKQQKYADSIEDLRNFWNQKTNSKTGTLVVAKIKGDERDLKVFVKDGLAIKLNEEDGSFEADIENSDDAVYYTDPDGKVQVTTADNLNVEYSETVDERMKLHTDYFAQQDMLQQIEINEAAWAYMAESEGREGDLETRRQETSEEAINAENLPHISQEESEKAAFMESLPVIESGKEAGEFDTERFTPEQNLKFFEYEYGKDEALSAAEKKVSVLKKNVQKEAQKLENDPFNIRQKRKVTAMQEELKAYSDYVFAEKEARTQQQIQETAPTSVLETREQQSKDIEQREAGRTGTASDVITKRWESERKGVGIKDVITLPNGEKIQGAYMLTNAFALSPSHDINRNFAKTEGFPVNEQGKTVNDRDYEADKTAQLLVQQRANQYDERAVQTPVVVSNEGVVLSGNDRTMSGQLAAQQGTDGAYVDYITKYAERWGFTPEAIQAVENPRIVFVPKEAMPYNTATFAKFNAEEKKTQNSLESAIKASKSVSKEVIIPLSDIVEQFDKLNDFYNNPQATKKAIGVLLQNGVIGSNEVPRLMDGDLLSQEGRSYFETLMLGSVLDESALREVDKMRSVRQTLMRSMPQLLRNAALKDYSLTGELNNAIHLLYEAKQAGNKVQLQLMQGNLFDATAEEIYSEVEKVLANLLENEKDIDFRRIFDNYNTRAADIEAGQVDMFDGVLTKPELLQQVLNHYYARQQEKGTKQTRPADAVN